MKNQICEQRIGNLVSLHVAAHLTYCIKRYMSLWAYLDLCGRLLIWTPIFDSSRAVGGGSTSFMTTYLRSKNGSYKDTCYNDIRLDCGTHYMCSKFDRAMPPISDERDRENSGNFYVSAPMLKLGMMVFVILKSTAAQDDPRSDPTAVIVYGVGSAHNNTMGPPHHHPTHTHTHTHGIKCNVSNEVLL